MKILIDPIYTNSPNRCASNSKMMKIVEHLLETTSDTFFYWLVPDWLKDEEVGQYPDSDRITLIEYKYSKNDRIREYLRLEHAYYEMISFQGDLWDFDIMITNRTSIVPLIKASIHKPGGQNLWSKKVFLIEDMPIMSFKDHVPQGHAEAQDMLSILGYYTADMTAISAFWEKDIILKDAKTVVTPTIIRNIKNTMIESSAVLVDKVKVKTKKSIEAMLNKKRPFTVGFIGRMTHGNNPDGVFSVMKKQWIYRSNGDKKMKFVISTQSKNTGRVDVPDFIEIKYLGRDDFWDLVENKMDLFVFLSVEEDYSMSLMEPLLLGCPAVLIKKYWSVPTVGEDYPFYVNNQLEAYGMIKEFYDNYPSMYKKFVTWSKNKFTKLMLDRNEVYVPYIFDTMVEQWYNDFKKHQPRLEKGTENEVLQMIIDYAQENGNDINLFEVIKALGKQGMFRGFSHKVQKKHRDKERLTFGVSWNSYRLKLMAIGFEDGSVEVGHLVKKEEA